MNCRKIVTCLEHTIGIDGQPRRLREAIEEELRAHFSLPPISASELAESCEPRIHQLILEAQAQRQKTGELPVLAISSVSDRVVMGSCHVELTDPPAIATMKQRRLHVEPILQRIVNLSFAEFEQFGSRILNELGAYYSRITPRADDQGIDFYGILSLGSVFQLPPPFFQLTRDIELRFVGQAKHYPDRTVGPSVVRELVGSISLARHQVFTRGPNFLEDLGLLALNPLLAMLFTTGRFTTGALDLARKSGLMIRSGEQLALFLAERGVGIIQVAGAPTYCEDAFSNWLNQS
jgi:hypothetical protein